MLLKWHSYTTIKLPHFGISEDCQFKNHLSKKARNLSFIYLLPVHLVYDIYPWCHVHLVSFFRWRDWELLCCCHVMKNLKCPKNQKMPRYYHFRRWEPNENHALNVSLFVNAPVCPFYVVDGCPCHGCEAPKDQLKCHKALKQERIDPWQKVEIDPFYINTK